VSLCQAGRDAKCGVIDFSIVTPAAEPYCAQYHAAENREETKNLKYFQAYKALDNTHFEPFVAKSGRRELGVRAQETFKKIYNLITQSTGQSGSSIAYLNRDSLSHLRRSRIPMHSDENGK
jgi:hypothetical protein